MIDFVWPTQFVRITQPFDANPQIYRAWKLPGHEGLDIRAPEGSKIFACSAGTVVRVDAYRGDRRTQPYGNSVRVQHADGLLTVYAHLTKVLVGVGQTVLAGQVLGIAGSTGNSTGPHLHLTVKHSGATAAGRTKYPNDIVDPTPFFPHLRANGVKTI